MISCRTVIGTAVIEIEKGIGLGQIHQVLVDDGVLLTFVVKSNQGEETYALLPGGNIHGIGDFAAMVKSSSALQAIDNAGLSALADKQGAIFDEMVITVDGNKIGRVVDYHIDPKNEIGFLVVNPENDGAEIQIPKSQILMIGKEYIILNEAAAEETDSSQAAPAFQIPETKAVESPTPAAAETAAAEVQEEELDRDAIFAQFDAAAILAKKREEAEEEKAPAVSESESLSPATEAEKSLTGSAPQAAKTAETKGAMSLEEAFSLTPEQPAEAAAPAEEAPAEQGGRVIPMTIPAGSEEGSSFLNEQKRLLVGKRLQKDLVGPDGNPILLADEVVTDGTIDLLRRIDRRLLVRLAGCVV